MLSIRTQDRMALVPYNNVIEAFEYEDYDKETNDKLALYEVEIKKMQKEYSRSLPHPKLYYYEELGNLKKQLKENATKQTAIELNDYTLGTYKSKERALEVLDEIERWIRSEKHLAIYKMPKE